MLPLARTFGLRSAIVTSMQALSGAGRSPGVAAMDILDNVLPYIPKEEEKVQTETSKILGTLEGDRIAPLDIPVSATCTRINVGDGHTLCVTASLGRPAELDEVAGALRAFGREFVDLGLPSTPPEIIRVTDESNRPQPRIDRTLNDGMTTVIGRIRRDSVLEHDPILGSCDDVKRIQRPPPQGVGGRILKIAFGPADSPALFKACGPRIILQTPVWGALRGWASRPSGEFRC